MSLPGKNAVVTIEHLTQTRDAHGGKTDGDPIPEDTQVGLDAVIHRPSRGNLWRITVAGNHGQITRAPSEWRITATDGRVFGATKATYRPPIERLAESEHTLIFAELHGEVDRQEVPV